VAADDSGFILKDFIDRRKSPYTTADRFSVDGLRRLTISANVLWIRHSTSTQRYADAISCRSIALLCTFSDYIL